MSFDIHTLITDRTQADVLHVQDIVTKIAAGTATASEMEGFLAGSMKGSYNATDLNRVGAAMLYLADRMNALGYIVHVSPRVDWSYTDSPTLEDMSHYLSCLALLRGVVPVTADMPPVPASMESLTYSEANDIEKILKDTERLLTNIAAAWFWSGEIYSGEVI